MERMEIKKNIENANKKFDIATAIAVMLAGTLIGIVIPTLIIGMIAVLDSFGSVETVSYNAKVAWDFVKWGAISLTSIFGLSGFGVSLHSRFAGRKKANKNLEEITRQFQKENEHIISDSLRQAEILTTIEQEKNLSAVDNAVETTTNNYIIMKTSKGNIAIALETLYNLNNDGKNAKIQKSSSEFKLLPVEATETMMKENPDLVEIVLAKKLKI